MSKELQSGRVKSLENTVKRLFIALVAAAAMIGSTAAHARVIEIFQGTRAIPPILLTNDLCVAGAKDKGWRAVMVMQSGRMIEACWNHATDRTIITCLTKNGERNGLVGGDCWWIDNVYFVEAPILPPGLH